MQGRYSLDGEPGPQFSLVFPVYNPGPVLDQTWSQVQEFRKQAKADWEFLFVCDGCTDGAAERLQTLAKGDGRIRVLSYDRNRGKGYAVRLGLEVARGRWRLFTDIDLAYGFEDISRLATTLQNGAEVAVASRVHSESRVVLPLRLVGYYCMRRIQSLAFARLARWVLPIQPRDTQAGLKGLSAQAAEILLPRLTTCGFEFDCELLTACARLGLEVTEVPVTVRYLNGHSTTTAHDIVDMLRKLWSIRRAWHELPTPQGIPLVTLAEPEA